MVRPQTSVCGRQTDTARRCRCGGQCIACRASRVSAAPLSRVASMPSALLPPRQRLPSCHALSGRVFKLLMISRPVRVCVCVRPCLFKPACLAVSLLPPPPPTPSVPRHEPTDSSSTKGRAKPAISSRRGRMKPRRSWCKHRVKANRCKGTSVVQRRVRGAKARARCKGACACAVCALPPVPLPLSLNTPPPAPPP